MPLVLRIALLSATAIAGGAVPALAGAIDPVPGQLVVQYHPGATSTQERAVRARAGVALERQSADGDIAVVSTEAGSEAEALSALRARPEVRRAFRDGYTRVRVLPNDPFRSHLWGLHNTGQAVDLLGPGTPGADIGAASAWDLQTAGALTAVVDSGVVIPTPPAPTSNVFTSHDDLTPNLWSNPGEVDANGTDDDGNGFIDDRIGWDFVVADDPGEGDRVPADGNGHGTHVAGTIGARGNNGRGVTGVAWTAPLMVLRTQGDDGSGTWSAMLLAFDYAGENGARVVNASLGAPATADIIDSVASIANAHPMTLYVFAAGNDGASLDSTIDAPCEAAAAVGNAICVAATDNTDALASYSNYGTSVAIGAPGSSILSTYPLGTAPSWQSPWYTYAYSDGTSMAAPHVAGAASLVAAASPSHSGAAIRSLLLASADARPGLGRIVGYRRLDVSAALRRLSDTTPPSSVAITAPAAGAAVSASPLVQWTAATSVSGAVSAYEVWLDDVLTGVTTASTRQWQLASLAPGAHTVQVQAVDDAGNRSPAAAASFSVSAPASSSTAAPVSAAPAASAAADAAMVLTLRGTQPVTLRAARGKVTLPLRCSGTERAACVATVSLRYKVKGRWKAVTGAQSARVAAGNAGTVRLALNAYGRLLLAQKRAYAAQVTIAPAGGSATTGRVRITR